MLNDPCRNSRSTTPQVTQSHAATHALPGSNSRSTYQQVTQYHPATDAVGTASVASVVRLLPRLNQSDLPVRLCSLRSTPTSTRSVADATRTRVAVVACFKDKIKTSGAWA